MKFLYLQEIHLITDVNVLTMQRLYRNDVFARHNATEEEYNKAMRHAAYRQYILFQYGRLDRGVLGLCHHVLLGLLDTNSQTPFGHYIPYEPSWKDCYIL